MAISSITSLGIGSGLDLNSLVDDLLAAEREPREKRLDRREAGLQAQISAFGSIRGGLAELDVAASRLATLRAGQTASSSDETRVTATANGSASTGRVTVEVEALARAQSLASVALADADAEVGTGAFTLQLGEREAVRITIDSGNDSLRGLRDAINQSDSGVSASIVNTGEGARLVLTSSETGAANTIALTVDGALVGAENPTGLARFATEALDVATAGQDARARINGLLVTSASNTLDGTVEGLRLELRGETEAGSPVRLDVGEDRGTIQKALEGFIDAYNAVVGQIGDFTRYNPDTQAAGLLLGDSLMRGLRGQLSAALTRSVGDASGLGNLVNLGVRSGENGKLALNAGALEQALDRDFAGSVGLINTVAGGLRDTVQGFTSSGGLLEARTDGLRSTVRTIDRQRETLETRMEQLETRLRRQFGAMDALVGQLQQSSSFLDQQLTSFNSMISAQRKR